MEFLILTIRLVLAAIFLLAGFGKLFDLEGSKKAVEDFGVPKSVSRPVSVLLPVFEIAVAILLLPIQTSWFGAIAGGGLLTLFIIGMLWQMWLGNAPDCHCFGQIHSEPVSIRSLLRNAGFVLLAVFLIARGQAGQGFDIFNESNNFSEMNVMQIILGFAVLGFLAAIVYFLKTISGQQIQIMRRIEVLELISHEGGREIERDDVNDPAGGLTIGAPVPSFEIPDLDGVKTSFENILPINKFSVLFFVSPTCNPCESLIPEFREWDEEFRDKINFVFITSGKAKDNLKKFDGDEFGRMFVQEKNEISELLKTEWTPTALFINSDRTIGSHPAAGDTAIRDLIENIREKELGDEPVFITNGHETKLGEPVPGFSLEDLHGEKISEEFFQDKKTLVTYWSSTCPYCVNMLEDLREWDKTRNADDPNLLLISSGEVEQHKEMDFVSPIVLDDEGILAGELGLTGTPSAVMINKNGRIVSEAAVGSDEIWKLLGKKK